MRFSLSKLFAAVALLALACSGMFYRTSLWADSIFTLTVVLLIGVLFWSMGRSGRQRAAGLAGGIVGLGYVFLVTSALFTEIRASLLTNYPLAWAARAMRVDGSNSMPTFYAPAPFSAPTISPPVTAVATGAFADASEEDTSTIPRGPTPSSTPPPVYAPAVPPPTLTPVAYLPQYSIKTLINYGLSFSNEGMPISHLFLIGHCVWSWLLALVGAWFAGRMYDRREKAARAAG